MKSTRLTWLYVVADKNWLNAKIIYALKISRQEIPCFNISHDFLKRTNEI